MGRTDEPGLPQRDELARVRTHAWVGYLLLGMVFLLWALLAARAASDRLWTNFAGYVFLAVVALVVPTGALKSLVRALSKRKPR